MSSQPNNRTPSPSPQQQVWIARIVCLAILCSVLVLLVVAYLQPTSALPIVLGGFPLALAVPLGVATAVMSLSIPQLLRRVLAGNANLEIVTRVVGAALAEAVAILGFVRALTTGVPSEMLPFAGVSLILLLIHLTRK